jgi:hypothetical protein
MTLTASHVVVVEDDGLVFRGDLDKKACADACADRQDAVARVLGTGLGSGTQQARDIARQRVGRTRG